jgi:geranylgeranyl pyrophosphate synthase
MLLAGGKRFRPKLLLAVVRAYNPLLVENAKYAAFAVELIHTYSLIHDDLPAIDNASLRRGHPTLHTTYDETTAILVGDALNTYAFEILSKAPMHNDVKIELIKTLSEAAGPNGMVLGQAIDCYFENKELNLEYNVIFISKIYSSK